jgi:O-antigen/teichoic acid export membrane protein
MTRALLKVFSFNVVAKIFLGLAGILLIRYMPALDYAHYTIALSVVAVVTQTLASSFNNIYIVGHESLALGENSNSFLAFQLLCVAILGLVTMPLVPRVAGIYGVTLALVVATLASEYSKSCFQRRQDFSRFALVEFLRAASFLVSVVTLVLVFPQYVKAWQSLVLQAACYLIVFILLSGIRLDGDLLRIGKATRLAVQIWRGKYRFLFAYFCILSAFSQLDVFMLKAIASNIQLATYGAAFRYYTLVSLALASIHVVLLPAIQQLKSPDQLDELLAKHVRILAIFALVTGAGAWAAQWIIPAIDMGKYPDSVMVFRILAVSAILSFALSPHVNLLMRFEDFRFLTILISVALFINVTLNFPLVRSKGAVGASIATLIAYLFLNGSIFLRARRYRGMLVESSPERNEVVSVL